MIGKGKRRKVIKYLGKGKLLLDCGHNYQMLSIRRVIPKTATCMHYDCRKIAFDQAKEDLSNWAEKENYETEIF